MRVWEEPGCFVEMTNEVVLNGLPYIMYIRYYSTVLLTFFAECESLLDKSVCVCAFYETLEVQNYYRSAHQ